MDRFMREFTVPHEVCDGIVDFYYNNDDYPIKRGNFGGSKESDLAVKDSHDVCVAIHYANFDSRIKSYLDSLNEALDSYFEEFPHAKMPCKISEKFNIQRYDAGGGYKVWHHERTHNKHAIRRHLVWMTYLTDNPDGGTEFYYQDLHVNAEKGKTLVWPAEWNYTHRSKIDTENEKMIITGWVELL